MSERGGDPEQQRGPGFDPEATEGPPTETGDTAAGAGDVEGVREQLSEEGANPAQGDTLPG
jgi:hypothetical protein